MILKPLLFGSLGWPEILLIALIVLLLFGAKRIPELMKSLGKGVKSFKQGINEVEEQINSVDEADAKPEKKASSEKTEKASEE